MKFLILALIHLFLAASFADVINETPEHLVSTGSYSHNGSKEIVYQRFGTEKGINGSIILSPGRTESSLKYSETAWDFIKAGYSPVYITNHQAQGFSERILKNSHKGYIKRFKYYYQDLNEFIRIALKDENLDKEKLYLVSHSMGAAIAMGYLQTYPNHPFKKVVFSAPMFKMQLNGKKRDSIIFANKSRLSNSFFTKLQRLC